MSKTSQRWRRDHAAPTATRHWFAASARKIRGRRARYEMTLKIEGVVNGGVHVEKTLGGASRLPKALDSFPDFAPNSHPSRLDRARFPVNSLLAGNSWLAETGFARGGAAIQKECSITSRLLLEFIQLIDHLRRIIFVNVCI